MSDRDPAMKRRNFFSLLGTGVSYGSLLVATPAIASELTSGSQRGNQSQPLAIGVIIPRSHLRPDLCSSFQSGLELAWDAHLVHGRRPMIAAAQIDVGGGGLAAAVQQLLGVQRPSVILGMLDARLADSAAQLCDGKAAFIDCSAGAIVPSAPSPQRAHVRLTLGQWQSAYALGRWAAGQGRRASIISTFYDAGYDGLYAFRLGFEDGGGEVGQAVVIDAPNQALGIDAALAQIALQRPDVVYAAIHDHHAGPFMTSWSQGPLHGDALLVANPFLVDYAHRHAQGAEADGVVVCSSYDPALDAPANHDFRQRYQQRHGRMPDVFAVLGHDAGMLVAAALGRCSPGAGSAQIMAACAGLEIASPRGRIAIDAQSASSRSSHYISACSWSPAGIERRIIDRCDAIDESDPRIRALQSGLRSGWVNPYMSV
jgi:branched-chain amino acid transport system substrate-binding protein